MDCPDCGEPLREDQLKTLMEGGSVYCGNCGKTFELQVVKINGKENEKSTGKKKNSKFSKSKKNHRSSNADDFSEAYDNVEYDTPKKTYYDTEDDYENVSPNQVYKDIGSAFPRKYSFIGKLNIFSSFFALLVAVISTIIFIVPLASNPGSFAATQEIYKDVFRIVVGYSVFFYDLFYVRIRIDKLKLPNYALDFVILGALSTIFGNGAGLFLLVKGVIIMFIALLDSAIFIEKYKRGFGETMLGMLNSYASVVGLILIIYNGQIFFGFENDLIRNYCYIAIISLLVDLCVLQFFAKGKKLGEIHIILAIAKSTCGILACFFIFAGLILAGEGIIMLFVAFLNISIPTESQSPGPRVQFQD